MNMLFAPKNQLNIYVLYTSSNIQYIIMYNFFLIPIDSSSNVLQDSIVGEPKDIKVFHKEEWKKMSGFNFEDEVMGKGYPGRLVWMGSVDGTYYVGLKLVSISLHEF